MPPSSPNNGEVSCSQCSHDTTRGMTTYILLPVVSILLAEYFKDVAWSILITRAIVLILFCLSMVMMISAFSMGITGILNPEIRDLRRLIRDIEDIKIFFKD